MNIELTHANIELTHAQIELIHDALHTHACNLASRAINEAKPDLIQEAMACKNLRHILFGYGLNREIAPNNK